MTLLELQIQDALKHLLSCTSKRETSQRTTRMKSFNMESTDTNSMSDSRRNTAAMEESVVDVETRNKGSPSLVDK